MDGQGKFSSCRFDFRIDSKNGLTPSRRKKVEKRHVNYNTLFKCKVCSKLLESRAALLAHKVVHNFFKCEYCDKGFQKKVLWRIHVRNKHGHQIDEPLYGSKQSEEMDAEEEALSAGNGNDEDKIDETVRAPEPPVAVPDLVSPPQPEVPGQPKAAPFLPVIHGASAGSCVPGYQTVVPPGMVSMNQGVPPAANASRAPVLNQPTVSSPNFPGLVCINVPIFIASGDGAATTLQPLPAGLPPQPVPFSGQTVNVSQTPANTVPFSQVPPLLPPAHAKPPAMAQAVNTQLFQSVTPVSSCSPKNLPALIKPPGYQPTPEELEPGEIRQRKSNAAGGNAKSSALPKLPDLGEKSLHHSPTTPSGGSDYEEVLDFSVQNKKRQESKKLISNESSCNPPQVNQNCSATAIDLSCKTSVKTDYIKTKNTLCSSEYKDDKQLMQDEYNKSSNEESLFGNSSSKRSSDTESPKPDLSTLKKKGKTGGLNKMVEKLWKTKMTTPSDTASSDTKAQSQIQQSESIDMKFELGNSLKEGTALSPELKLPIGVTMETQDSIELQLIKNDRCFGRSALFGDISSQNLQVEEELPEVIEVPSSSKVPLFPSHDVTSMSNWKLAKEKEQDYSTFKFHVCPICKELLGNSGLLRQHMRKEHSVRKTPRKPSVSKPLTSGSRIGKAQKRMQCPRCKFSSSSLFALKYHRITVHPEMYGSTALSPENSLLEQDPSLPHSVPSPTKPVGRTLTCRYPGCGKVFKEHRQLRVHQTFHTSEKAMTCNFCPYTCQYEGSMAWHMRSQHQNSPKQDPKSDSPIQLETQRNTEPQKEENQENFIEEDVLSNDGGSSSEGLVVDLTTSSRANSPSSAGIVAEPLDQETPKENRPEDKLLSLYKVEASPGPEPKFFTSVMRFKSSRKSPASNESSKFTCCCDKCGISCEDAEALWNHILVQHSGEYTIVCDSTHCNYHTKDKCDLQSHMMSTHGKELGEFKDFICFLCGKGYASKNGLNHHMMRHCEGGPPVFACREKGCQSRLISKAALRSHMRRVHYRVSETISNPQATSSSPDSFNSGDDRMLACNYPGCKRWFRESKHLKVHRMQHTNEKPLKCDLCFYSCRQRNSMNWHMKSKHGMDKHVTPDGRTIYLGSGDSDNLNN